MTTYEVRMNGDVVLAFRANFSQAGSPIKIVGDDGEDSTPFQVADFRHRPIEAAKGLNGWLRNQGGEAWGRGAKSLTLRSYNNR